MRAWGPCRRPRRLATRRPPPVTIPFRRVHVRGDDCATTTLLQCDEQPDCQRTGQAAAPHPAAPLGARPSASGSPAPATGQGAGQPPRAAAPRTQRGRDVSYVASGRPVRPSGRADPAGVSIDRFGWDPRGEPAWGCRGWGTGPMWPRGPEGLRAGSRVRALRPDPAVSSLERR